MNCPAACPIPVVAGIGELTTHDPALGTIADAALTRAYYSRPDEEQAYYDLVDARYRNQSLAPYPLSAAAHWATMASRKPRASGLKATKPAPSSRQASSSTSSGLRVHSEYSDCTAAIG